MKFNVIHYRPNGSDYFRGCIMGTSDSDFELHTFEDMNEAANSIAEKEFWNEKNKDPEYARWQTKALIDGHEEYEEESKDDFFDELKKATQKRLEILFKEEDDRLKKLSIALEEKKSKDIELAAKKKEEADRILFEKLKAKYG